MTQQAGNYNDPSYLVRQQVDLVLTTAGSGTVSTPQSFCSDMRIRNGSFAVKTAGTSTGAAVYLLCVGTCLQFPTGGGTATATGTGTTTIGTWGIGTSAAYTAGTTGDMNVRIVAGSTIVTKNGTDATVVGVPTVEAYLDPQSATYTGPLL